MKKAEDEKDISRFRLTIGSPPVIGAAFKVRIFKYDRRIAASHNCRLA